MFGALPKVVQFYTHLRKQIDEQLNGFFWFYELFWFKLLGSSTRIVAMKII